MADIFVNDEYGVFYNKEADYGNYMLGFYSESRNYVVQEGLNLKMRNIHFTNNIYFSKGSSLSFELLYSNTDYVNLLPIRVDDSYLCRLGYSYPARRDMNLNLEIVSEKLKSTASENNFDNIIAMISIEYFTR